MKFCTSLRRVLTLGLAIPLQLILFAKTPPTCEANYFEIINGGTVTFFGASTHTGTIISSSYNFGDGSSVFSGSQNPIHSFPGPGTYQVCHTINTSYGCSDTKCKDIVIQNMATCNSGYTYAFDNCATVNFQDNSYATPGFIVSNGWNFGDGTIVNETNPTHTFTSDGTYFVCNTITTSDSCSHSFCQNITIGCGNSYDCEGLFSYSNIACPNIQFTSLSTTFPGIITSYFWDYGDSSYSSIQNPVHLYGQNGTYPVCLQIETSDGCFSQFCDTVEVSCYAPSTCNASWNMISCTDGMVSFSNSSTSSPGFIANYHWDFGDSSTSSSVNPQHSYLINGNYDVCLEIMSIDSCVSTFCQTIQVDCGVDYLCELDFVINDSCLEVEFSPQTYAYPGTVSSYSWDFGDETNSSSQMPTHIYGSSDTYEVCLEINTTDGCQIQKCDTLELFCPTEYCYTDFEFTEANLIANFQSLSFSNGTILSYQWDFGDGSPIDSSMAPIHTYAEIGNYHITHLIIADNGCSDTISRLISIGIDNPCGLFTDFEMGPDSCLKMPFVNLSSASLDQISSFSWIMEDTIVSNVDTFHYVFPHTDDYTYCLATETQNGCKDTLCDSTMILGCESQCMLNINIGYEFITCDSVQFYDESIGNEAVFYQGWTNFGTTIGNEKNPTHKFDSIGIYNVCLYVLTRDSCIEEGCREINIQCQNNAFCEAKFDFGVSGNMILVEDISTSVDSIISTTWTFGDNSPSVSNNLELVHSYSVPDDYEVCLTIVTSSGCESTYCKTITVGSAIECQSLFTFEPDPTTCGLINFDQLATTIDSGNVDAFLWDFGNNNYSTDPNTDFLFLQGGEQEVCLTVSRNGQCHNTYCDTITTDTCYIPEECSIVFDYIRDGNTVYFNSTWTGAHPATVLQWSFDDGTTSTTADAIHTFPGDGVYNVCVTGTPPPPNFCLSTACDTIYIGCAAPDSFWVTDTTATTATLNWRSRGDVPEFQLAWRVQGRPWSIWNLSETSYEIESLVPDTIIEWKVKDRCSSPASNFGWSPLQTFRTPGGMCVAPQNKIVEEVTDITAKIKWDIFGDTERHMVAYKPLGGLYKTEKSYSYANSILLENLTPETTYLFKIKDLCNDPQSSFGWSDLDTFVTTTSTCLQPFNLTAINVGENTADLTWTASPNNVNFQAAYRPVGGSWSTKNVNTPSASIQWLIPNQQYEWKVKDRCNFPASRHGWSPISTFMTAPPTCVKAVDLQAYSLSPTEEVLVWTSGILIQQYQLAYREVGSSWNLITLAVGEISIIIDNLNPASDYEWKVRDYCEDPGSRLGWTSIASFTTSPANLNPANGSSISFGTDFSIFPNPGSGLVSLESTEGVLEPLRIEIYDQVGRKIISNHLINLEKGSPHSLDLSGFNNGIYFINIQSKSTQKTLKYYLKRSE